MRISDWSSDVCSSDLLLRVNDALHCAGWQPFDEWLAESLVPERRYPQGYAIHRRRRRPLPEERPPTEAEQNGEEIADIVQIPERLVEQPEDRKSTRLNSSH